MTTEKRRRGYREGTIIERLGANGKPSYQAQVWVDGRRLSKTVTTKTAAQKWIREILNTADRGYLPADGGKVKVGEYLDTWLQTIAPSIKPRTREQYADITRLHLKPRLATLRLNALRRDHVQTLCAEKLAAGLSPRTVHLIVTILHHALNDAMKSDLLARNVADAVTLPKQEHAEMRVWTPEQAKAFLASLSGHRWEALYVLALQCGLRAGELLGLKWEDCDLDAKTLQVRRTLQRLMGLGKVEGTPKTAKGRRTITLPTPAVEALRRRRIRQLEERLLAGDRWQDTGYVFTTEPGGPSEPSNLRRDFYLQIERAGLPRIRFHDLRHTAATILLQQGVPVKLVQTLLGHAHYALTMDTYTHVLPSMRDQAAEAMERFYGAS